MDEEEEGLFGDSETVPIIRNFVEPRLSFVKPDAKLFEREITFSRLLKELLPSFELEFELIRLCRSN